jgi:hypothetical protein
LRDLVILPVDLELENRYAVRRERIVQPSCTGCYIKTRRFRHDRIGIGKRVKCVGRRCVQESHGRGFACKREVEPKRGSEGSLGSIGCLSEEQLECQIMNVHRHIACAP